MAHTDQAVERFNELAADLQASAFPRARTPNEWKRLAANPRTRDYAELLGPVVPLVSAFATLDLPEDRAAFAEKLNPDTLQEMPRKHLLRRTKPGRHQLALQWTRK